MAFCWTLDRIWKNLMAEKSCSMKIKKGQRQGRLSKEIDIEYELAKETHEKELLETGFSK